MKKVCFVLFIFIQASLYAQSLSLCSKNHFIVGTDVLYCTDLYGESKTQQTVDGTTYPQVNYRYTPETSSIFYFLSAWVGYFPFDNLCFGVGMARPQSFTPQTYSPITPFFRYYFHSASSFSKDTKRSNFFIELAGFAWGNLTSLDSPPPGNNSSQIAEAYYTTLEISPGLGYTFLITKRFALEAMAQYQYTYYKDINNVQNQGQSIKPVLNTIGNITVLNCLLRAQFYFGQ